MWIDVNPTTSKQGLMEDMDGSRLIMRCLDTFAAAHNQVVVVHALQYMPALMIHQLCGLICIYVPA